MSLRRFLFYSVLFQLFLNEYIFVKLVIIGSSILTSLSFLKLTFSKPGTKLCKQLCEKNNFHEIHNLKTFSHCFKCDACVYKKDHHCPWVKNCIAHNNKKHFLTFLMAKTINLIYLYIPYKDYWMYNIFNANSYVKYFFLILYFAKIFALFSLTLYHLVLTVCGVSSIYFVKKIRHKLSKSGFFK